MPAVPGSVGPERHERIHPRRPARPARSKIRRMPRLVVALLAVLCLPSLAPAQPGALVVVGGGGTGPEIVAKALELSGGKHAIVAVLPQSSALADAGEDSVEMWLEAGAAEAANVTFDDRSAAASALRRATLIWMPGGDQNRFMKAIEDTWRPTFRSGVEVTRPPALPQSLHPSR